MTETVGDQSDPRPTDDGSDNPNHNSERTYCSRCGHEYDWYNQDPPENPSFYSVPVCPVCNADMTANPPTESWLNIISTGAGTHDPNIEKIHAHARLYHGRLANVDVDGLIERAKWFDQKESHNGWGPNTRHAIAFALRRQAREKLSEEVC